MAMGKKPAARQPSPMWVTTADLPTSAGHPFFERLNRVLIRRRVAAGPPESASWADMFIGYFDGAGDCVAGRGSLMDLETEAPPNHSTLYV